MEIFLESVSAGARRVRAAAELGLSVRTLQRWLEDGQVQPDHRPGAARPKPHNALTDQEQQAILDVCNQPEYASLPPSQIVPKLLDQGRYLGSESSFYRVLQAANQQHHRGRSKAREKRPITTHTATAPNQVWCWDISYCGSTVKGRYWYLYLIIDLFSRKIVGWEIHDQESGELAKELVTRTVLKEKCAGQPLVLHSDNGSPMKASTLQAKLDELGIRSSHSRPRVSNDNAYSESLFRTLKYCPQWPSGGFETLTAAREWMLTFARYYNEEHRHSGIRFVTPEQRHQGQDKAVLERRKHVCEMAMKRHPERWSQKRIRNLSWQDKVTLNPVKKEEIQAVKMAA